MADQHERLINAEQWKNEINAIIQDVKDYVKEIVTAEKLSSTNSAIFINLTTHEGKRFCVELTSSGFRIVGNTYNETSEPRGQYYETPYSLLDNISPCYREKFSSSLAAKLLELNNTQGEMSSISEEEITN